jgi:uncharacterized membrane protein YphA (DoxX/SURF4 family)
MHIQQNSSIITKGGARIRTSVGSGKPIPTTAILSTILEITFGLMLLLSYYTRYASFGAAALTLLFALIMAYSFGIKESFDYSDSPLVLGHFY